MVKVYKFILINLLLLLTMPKPAIAFQWFTCGMERRLESYLDFISEELRHAEQGELNSWDEVCAQAHKNMPFSTAVYGYFWGCSGGNHLFCNLMPDYEGSVKNVVKRLSHLIRLTRRTCGGLDPRMLPSSQGIQMIRESIEQARQSKEPIRSQYCEVKAEQP